MVAAIRPDDINVALFVHVAGAMLLVGTLLVTVASLVGAWRTGDTGDAAALTRLGLKAILLGVVPAWVVMRVGGQWTESREGFPDDYDPDWLGVGYLTADIGGILLLLSVVAAAIGLRRARDADRGGGNVLARVLAVVAIVLLAAYLVAMWAMTTKPGV